MRILLDLSGEFLNLFFCMFILKFVLFNLIWGECDGLYMIIKVVKKYFYVGI